MRTFLCLLVEICGDSARLGGSVHSPSRRKWYPSSSNKSNDDIGLEGQIRQRLANGRVDSEVLVLKFLKEPVQPKQVQRILVLFLGHEAEHIVNVKSQSQQVAEFGLGKDLLPRILITRQLIPPYGILVAKMPSFCLGIVPAIHDLALRVKPLERLLHEMPTSVKPSEIPHY